MADVEATNSTQSFKIEIKTLNKKNEILIERCKEYTLKYKEEVSRNQCLQSKHDVFEKLNNENEIKINKLQIQINDLNTMNSTINEDNRLLNAKNTQQQENNKLLSEEINAKTKQIQQLEQKQQAMSQQFGTMQQEIDSLRDIINSQNEIIQSLKEKSENNKIRNESLYSINTTDNRNISIYSSNTATTHDTKNRNVSFATNSRHPSIYTYKSNNVTPYSPHTIEAAKSDDGFPSTQKDELKINTNNANMDKKENEKQYGSNNHTPISNITFASYSGKKPSRRRVSFGIFGTALKTIPSTVLETDYSTDSASTYNEHQDIYDSDDSGLPRMVSRNRSLQSVESFQPELPPCKGDPFWDYYRTIGDISRAVCNELIQVMKFISAEDIMRQLLQNWLHHKVEPIELPYANINRALSGNFNLHSSSIILFVRQSLNSVAHPECFDLPELTNKYYETYDDDDDNISSTSRSSSRSVFCPEDKPLNIIGQTILGFLDQLSFLNACLVSRAWLYCGRLANSRCHIKFRVWNALKCLVKDTELLSTITQSNDIISIHKFIKDTDVDLKINDGDEMKSYNDNYNKYINDDILINCVSENTKSIQESKQMHDVNDSLPDFFSTRIECRMFSNITQLQYDFTIPSHNKLIYYINQSLLDSYWKTLGLFFQIHTLKKLDLLFPDPHLLLVAYILQHSEHFGKTSKRIVFPSIGVPKSKFICYAKQLKYIRFAVKSLTISKLEVMLNTHFEHYYHPIHHKNHDKHQGANNVDYAQYMYSQCNRNIYAKLDIYKLCRKVINKSVIFDITNALHCLNHQSEINDVGKSLKKITTIEEVSLCDVQCLTQELSMFLNNNSKSLKSIQLLFTQKCLRAKYIPKPVNRVYSPIVTPSTSTSVPCLHDFSEASPYYGEKQLLSLEKSTISHDKGQNNKKNRTKQIVTDLFAAILKYIQIETAAIHEYNRQIKKQFKLAKKSAHKAPTPRLQIAYANRLRLLPLESLSFSFPYDLDVSYLDGYIELFKWFENNDCLEILLKNIYLDGGCITPFTFSNNSNNNNNTLIWSNVLESQISNIQVLVMKRVLYSSPMFYENFSAGFVSQLKKIDLQIIYSDEYDDPYLHNKSRQPIYELFESLTQCQLLEILHLDLVQYPQNCNDIHSTIVPYLDISWIDNFMKSEYIKNTITQINITFNELLTEEFENISPIPKFTETIHSNAGTILRINKSFKDEIEQLIMSWFGECPQLYKIRLIRHINLHESHLSNRYVFDQNIDFQNQLQFEKKSKLIMNQLNHNIVFYGVSKRIKVGDIYRGEVFGDLTKILEPNNLTE